MGIDAAASGAPAAVPFALPLAVWTALATAAVLAAAGGMRMAGAGSVWRAGVTLAGWTALLLALALVGAQRLLPSGAAAASPSAASFHDTVARLDERLLLGRNCTRAPFRLQGTFAPEGFGRLLQDQPCRAARQLVSLSQRWRAADASIAQACTPTRRRWVEHRGEPGCAAPVDACAAAACRRASAAQALLTQAWDVPADFKDDDSLGRWREATATESPGSTREHPLSITLTLAGLLSALGLGTLLGRALHELCVELSATQPRSRAGDALLRMLHATGCWKAPPG